VRYLAECAHAYLSASAVASALGRIGYRRSLKSDQRGQACNLCAGAVARAKERNVGWERDQHRLGAPIPGGPSERTEVALPTTRSSGAALLRDKRLRI